MNPDFAGVDVDLLADYIGGALDGTPEHARVAGLIARDETWQAAYQTLAAGMAAVGIELRALGAEPEPMPADVVDRLDRAFPATTGPHGATADRGRLVGARLVAVGGDERPARTGAATARARRARKWAVPVAVAAVVLAFAGFGINYLLGPGQSPITSSATSGGGAQRSNGQSAPEAASGGLLATLPPAGRILSSGADYEHGTLSAGPPVTLSDSARGAAPLDRLRPPAALLACLNAIAAENGAGPISVHTVDYARYAGAPAVVVRFTAGNGSWAWASGPDCGAPGLGASRLDAAKVG